MDLYKQQLSRPLQRLCGGSNNEDGEGESCVTAAPIGDVGIAIGHTERPGVELRYTREEWTDAGLPWVF